MQFARAPPIGKASGEGTDPVNSLTAQPGAFPSSLYSRTHFGHPKDRHGN